MPASVPLSQTMAKDDQDGSAAATSPPLSWSSREISPSHSPGSVPPCPEDTYREMGGGFTAITLPHPPADADSVIPARVMKWMPAEELFAPSGSPHGVSAQALDVDANTVQVGDSDTASVDTTRQVAFTDTPVPSTASTTSEAGAQNNADGDAPLPDETSHGAVMSSSSTFQVDLPHRTPHGENDVVPNRTTENKRKASASETDGIAHKRTNSTTTRNT